MAIRSFNLSPARGLAAAQANDVPNLIAIAGPNGSGKSTLLEQLWNQRHQFLEPSTQALYVGPNRTWRAGSLNELATRGFNFDYSQILQAEAIPGFQFAPPGGFHWLGGLTRFGSNADDAQALVKTSIVRISNQSEAFIAEQFRRQGNQIAPGSVPNLLDPLRELVSQLLPHLEFDDINSADANDVKVLFRSRDPMRSNESFDIDHLSSGEKAAIALFLPFIERQIKAIIGNGDTVANGQVPITVLLDEPEIHLHPLLQLNMLEYMREIARNDEAQFIFTTHSPTLLDALEPQELFLLSPASVAPDNQLSRLSDDSEKLEVARSITGGTHLLTRGKPIVFIEGEPDTGHTASDQRVMKLLLPEAEHWAIVPAGGRSQVVKAVSDLHSAHLALPGAPVFGLTDADQNSTNRHDRVITWPVAMIENLLLDPASIATVLAPYSGLGESIKSTRSIESCLKTIAKDRTEDEVRLRVQDKLPSITLRPSEETVEKIKDRLEKQLEQYQSKLAAVDLASIVNDARTEVEKILSEGLELERFRGKLILKEFFKRHRISDAGLGWNVFLTEIARHARRSERVRNLTMKSIVQIKLYFPPELIGILEEMPSGDNRDLSLEACRKERDRWVRGEPQEDGREDLRADLFSLARASRETDPSVAQRLARSAAAIGTPS
ncbi:AAA family ATPase [Nocardia tengchongensis]|uniref:AAA family ATPase n=1 Tax=Nocardia tengchongensis TaxID=2055889 RepID=UPI00369B8193